MVSSLRFPAGDSSGSGDVGLADGAIGGLAVPPAEFDGDLLGLRFFGSTFLHGLGGFDACRLELKCLSGSYFIHSVQSGGLCPSALQYAQVFSCG